MSLIMLNVDPTWERLLAGARSLAAVSLLSTLDSGSDLQQRDTRHNNNNNNS